MTFYADWILPRLIHVVMRRRDLIDYRRRVLAGATGRVLEIGIGSGLNLPFYRSAARQIIGLDPSVPLLGMTRRAAASAANPPELIDASAEAIPLDTHSVDTVVMTWTLCSIPDAPRALTEIRRVLKPAGRLLFVEHGRSPQVRVERWQDRLTPVWRRISGGCHLNRKVDALIEASGLRIERLETGYMRGPKPMTYMYEGTAIPR